VDGADEITVELVSDATDEVRALIGELERVLAAEYAPEHRHGLALDEIFKPDVRFSWLARTVKRWGAAEWHSSRISPRSSACMFAKLPAGVGWLRRYLHELKGRYATRDLFCSN